MSSGRLGLIRHCSSVRLSWDLEAAGRGFKMLLVSLQQMSLGNLGLSGIARTSGSKEFLYKVMSL